jgi:predicted TIM-barrel fold metal-dependent hydrolase
MHRIAVALHRKDPDLYPFVTTFDLRNWKDPGFADAATGWLRTAFADGAVGVKIWKEVGLELKRDDGRFLMPDDPLFDPVYAFIAREQKTLIAHLAEPIDAWLPLDPKSPHYQYYSANPKWHLHGKPGYPAHAEIIAARDRILEKHPTLVVVGAHLGSLEHDLDGLAQRLDRYPNFNVDCAGRLRNLSFHPADKARDFLIKYQDRVVYGVDLGWRPHRGGPATDALRREYVRRVERRHRDDFAFLAGSGQVEYTGRTVQALNLPKPVLEKLYNANATRLFKLKATPPARTEP